MSHTDTGAGTLADPRIHLDRDLNRWTVEATNDQGHITRAVVPSLGSDDTPESEAAWAAQFQAMKHPHRRLGLDTAPATPK
ncbi:hypothetical protein HNR23_002259 [Nocardiopsis mwathae]|uniref:Uncharacterized protein n=1 Tax=Nocardiopsis mwathae TaxID=1472723 RepID=A0A7W9YHI3_9ACTN|nr:hypothetical protein [Nocardiopsis mwathae]MBB6172199.1 hypothetical protein [Nocardiopsis mwathae]